MKTWKINNRKCEGKIISYLPGGFALVREYLPEFPSGLEYTILVVALS